MNSRTSVIITAFALTAGLAAAQNPVTVQPAASARITDATNLAQGVYIASIDVNNHSLRRYAGQKLFNTQGAELGTVKDFIVHPASSRLRYLVVSSGGVLGGMGNSLRLVPVEALRQSARGNIFEVDILQGSWLQIPPVNDEDYVADRFAISPIQHQQMVQLFGATTGTAMPREEATLPGLIRASAIRGKSVYAANQKVGDIENIVVDLGHGTASALIDSSGDFTGTSAKYLVPLSRLTFTNPRQNRVATTLTRADFDGARPSQLAASINPASAAPIVATEPPLTPTGRIENAVVQPTADAVAVASRSIRQTLTSDPVLVTEHVQVRPENGHIVLRGSVSTETAKRNIENAARRVAPTVTIDNQLTVINR